MDLTRIIDSNEVDFTPDGVTNFLAKFSRSAPDATRRISALTADPRYIIEHAFELTRTQQALLASTDDDALRASLKPVFDALSEGKTLRVLGIQTIAEGARLEEPVIRDQQAQQAQRQIVITIGRGRCKITITIDL